VSTKAFERNLSKIEVKKADFQENTIPEEPLPNAQTHAPNAIDKLDTDSSTNSAEDSAPTEPPNPPSDPKPSPSEDSSKLIEINTYTNPKGDSYTYREKTNGVGVAQNLLQQQPSTTTYEVKLDNR
jgi:hypothetical protein